MALAGAHPRGGVVMNTWRIALVLMVTFAMGSGCAKPPDWIEQTLVTVDVTGTWRGPGALELKLEQHGSKVTGTIFVPVTTTTGTIEGSVSGDVFRFRQTSGTYGPWQGQLTVNGDEMSGLITSTSGATTGGRPQINAVLKRVSSSPPPSQQ